MGGERTTAAPVEEIVFVLDRFAPARLDDLRVRFPESAETILRRGVLAGAGERKIEEIKARAETALEGVEVIETLCTQGLVAIGRRLTTANRLDLVGEVTSVLGSSSALLSIAQEHLRFAGTGAAIALLGALTAIGSKHLRRGVRGGKDDLLGPYTILAQAAPQAVDLGRELKFIMKMPSFSTLSEAREQIAVIIKKTNELSRQVYEAIVNVPGLEPSLKSGNV